jgi:hypothetical protein
MNGISIFYTSTFEVVGFKVFATVVMKIGSGFDSWPPWPVIGISLLTYLLNIKT